MFSLQWDRPMEWSQERKSESEIRSVVSDSLQPHGLYSPWNSPGQNTGMGSLSLLQGIFPTQGSNPGLPHCRQILDQLRHKGDPRILEWVAYPFSTRSSWPRNWTRVSCIAGGFFASWGTREALNWFQRLKRKHAAGLNTGLDRLTAPWTLITLGLQTDIPAVQPVPVNLRTAACYTEITLLNTPHHILAFTEQRAAVTAFCLFS